MYELDYAFRDAYSNETTKSSMLLEDKLVIEMISLMRGSHGGAQGLELGLQTLTLPIKKGFARVVVAVRAEHLVREGTRSQHRKIHGGVKDKKRQGIDRSLRRVWSEDTCVRANTGREETTTVED